MAYLRFLFFVIIWIWLLLWQVFQSRSGCILTILFITPILALIARSMLENSIMRRRATISMYLIPEGWLHRFLQNSIFLVLWQFMKATFLSLYLVNESIFFQPWVWVVLFADLIFLWVGHNFLVKKLSDQVKYNYAPVFAGEYIIIANSIALSFILGFIGFFVSYPDYRDLSWYQAVEHDLTQLQSECYPALVLARVSAAKNAISWWLAEKWFTKINDSYLAYSAWFIFLINSTIFTWAFSRMLIGIKTWGKNWPK